MTEPRKPLLNVHLRWFLLAMILANIASQMVFSLISLYLVELGATVGQVGLVFTVASLVPTVLQILGGWLSDTIGRLRAIALGSTISCLGYLAFFLSPSWEWVMVGLCIRYVANAFVGPSYSAYIAEQSSEEQRGRVFGLAQSIFMVVTVIGPAIGGLMAYRLGFKPMLLAALLFYGSATVVRVWMATAERFAPERAAERPTWSGMKAQLGAMAALLVGGGLLTWIWITDAIYDTALNLVHQLFSIYMSDIGRLNLEQIGWLNSVWGAASILAGYAAGWLADRYGERAVIVGGFIVDALALVAFVQARTLPLFLVAMFLSGLGVGALMPAYESLISKAVPEERRGLAYGLFGTSLGLLNLPFPWIGAQLWEHFGPQTPFWLTVAATLVAIPIAWFKFVVPRQPAADV